jgi:chromosome partitioning protein
VEVSSAIISFRVAFRHCLASGNTAAEYEPGGRAAQEISRLYDDMSARLHVDTPARGMA